MDAPRASAQVSLILNLLLGCVAFGRDWLLQLKPKKEAELLQPLSDLI